MPSTNSPNKVYELQATGEDDGTWGVNLNAVLSKIDLNLGGRQAVTIDVADVTLTATQCQNVRMLLTGALTGDRVLNFPAANGGFFLVDNATSGAHLVTAKPTGGTGVVLPQGTRCLVFIDPTQTTAYIYGTPQVLTTQGDILYRDANGVARLGAGTLGQFLKTGGAAANPSWGALPVPGYLFGATMANGTDATNDINFAAGSAMDSTAAIVMVASALVKQLDGVWAVGTNAGGRFLASIANGTWHCYMIRRPDTGVVDYGFSDSATDPTGGANYPAAYTQFRRIGSILRESAAIVAFSQDGDEFLRLTGVLDANVNGPGLTAALVTLSVPTGIKVGAKMQLGLVGVSGQDSVLLVTSPDQTDVVPSTTNGDLIVQGTLAGQKTVRTNTSSQVRRRNATSGNGNITVSIFTYGWVDTRGRLA